MQGSFKQRMEFITKTVQIRQCRRCKSLWSGEHVELKVQEQIQFITVTVPHCPVCSEGFAAEIDRPSYRRSGKRVK